MYIPDIIVGRSAGSGIGGGIGVSEIFKFHCDGQVALSGKLSCIRTGLAFLGKGRHK